MGERPQPSDSGRKRPVIAIDGPVGAGKSTVARRLAEALGFACLNTGAMYRAVAVAVRYNDIALGSSDDRQNDARLRSILDSITIKVDGERVLLDGRDISGELAAPPIGELASQLSARAEVRTALYRAQRAAGEAGGVVMEGRDIGTVIFPDAEFKFFLTADLRVRAARRFAELKARGFGGSEAEVRAELKQRDRRDQRRELAPLKRAAGAILIDASALSVDQVVGAMLERVTAPARTSRA